MRLLKSSDGSENRVTQAFCQATLLRQSLSWSRSTLTCHKDILARRLVALWIAQRSYQTIKNAMVSSCLYPYKDMNGRYYPSILAIPDTAVPAWIKLSKCYVPNMREPSRAPQMSWDAEAGLTDHPMEPPMGQPAAQPEKIWTWMMPGRMKMGLF